VIGAVTETEKELVIDRLGRSAEEAPHAPLLPGQTGEAWRRLTNARAWAESGAVASWLIAQGFGPGLTPTLSVEGGDGPERAVLLLGALRAGAPVVATTEATGATLRFVDRDGLIVPSGPHGGIALAALARGSIDAAVAERRLHIDGKTPARLSSDICVRQADLRTVAEAVDAGR
jgi:feruloyl-CoA synthase